jgi:virginiamycin A acetyltransferase
MGFGNDKPINAWISDPISRANQRDKEPNQFLQQSLVWLYHFKRLRKFVIRAAIKFEKGAFYSRIVRRILAQHHDVEVGLYSYGAILDPGVLPPGTKVGRYCSVGQELIVRRRNHPIGRLSQHPFFYNAGLGYLLSDTIPSVAENPLTIGHDVWIGDRVTIVPGCRTIGNGAVIAAGAVVTRDVPSYTIVAGCPAVAKGERFCINIAQKIEKSQWWQLALADLLASRNDLLSERPFEASVKMHKNDA